MFVRRPVPQVVDGDRQVPGGNALAQNALDQEAVQHPRKERQNINGEWHRRAAFLFTGLGKRKIARASGPGDFEMGPEGGDLA
jgi:hypothetical protein